MDLTRPEDVQALGEEVRRLSNELEDLKGQRKARRQHALRRGAMVLGTLLLLIGGAVAAAVTYRSAIPFGTASSWSNAVGNDPSATQGLWYNNAGHAFARTNNGTDWQIDTQNFNILAYGADPTGVSDSSTAIQAAITAAKAAGNAIVYAPPGTYLIASSIIFNTINGMQFVGAGRLVTTFKWGGAASSVMFNLQGISYSKFKSFSMIGDAGGAGGTQTAILYNGILNSVISTKNVFEDIFIQSGFAYGIRIGTVAYQVDQTEYHNVLVYNTSTRAVSIEDANAVLHDFYDCNFQYNVDTISSSASIGTGGSFNIFGGAFVLNTGVDIQTYPGSRGYIFDGVAFEGDNIILQMPQASTNTSVSMVECSVNGTKSAGPHIRAGAGSLNIIGGKYLGTYPGFGPFPFTISVGNDNGYTSNINVVGTTFPEGSPFTGANIAQYGAIRLTGVKYAAIGGDTGDTLSQSIAAWDTGGTTTTIYGGRAGLVQTLNGQPAGPLKLLGAPGVDGTASLKAGKGGDVFAIAANPGLNNGGGDGDGGNFYIGPGYFSGAGAEGRLNFVNGLGATLMQWCPSCSSSNLFPQTTNTQTFGGPSNFFRQGYFARSTSLGQTVAAATTVTLNPASGSAIRINLSGTAISTVTYTAGTDGDRTSVCVAQDATGSRTIPTTWGNVRFAGGSYVASTGANRIDCINFEYNGTAAAYLETSRSMNDF